VRDEQTRVLRAMTPFPPEDGLKRAVRGPYTGGRANVGSLQVNGSVLPVQPGEGVSLRFGAKPPGAALRIEPADLRVPCDAHLAQEGRRWSPVAPT
jgi:glucose-6-phosphate 1-dehydrogenase